MTTDLRAALGGEPQQLFDASPYITIDSYFDVAPDGRFLMKRPVGAVTARPDEIILVEIFSQSSARK